MLPTINDVTQHLEQKAPLSYQEGYDNSGLLIGNPNSTVHGVLCALDVTEEIIDEAEKKNCNLIVTHHPLIFTGLKRLVGSTLVERCVVLAIQKNIAVYAAHTNLDNVLIQGVNSKIAEQLDLQDSQILLPKSELNSMYGSGLIGRLNTPMNPLEFLTTLKEKMNASVIRHTDLLNKKIKHVAVCGGAGKFLLEYAIEAGADVFISADFKYHDFFEANDKIVIADIGHYESEQFTINLLKDIISAEFSTFAAHCTNLITNPINYF